MGLPARRRRLRSRSFQGNLMANFWLRKGGLCFCVAFLRGPRMGEVEGDEVGPIRAIVFTM